MKNIIKNLSIALSLGGFVPTLATVYLASDTVGLITAAAYISVLLLAIKLN